MIDPHAVLGGAKGVLVQHLLKMRREGLGVVVPQYLTLRRRDEHYHWASTLSVRVVVVGQSGIEPVGLGQHDGRLHLRESGRRGS